MRMIFCSDYWNPLLPEPTYVAEVNATKKVGLDYALINFEAFYRALTDHK